MQGPLLMLCTAKLLLNFPCCND